MTDAETAALETEIKTLIIESLDLEDITVDDIISEEPLFNDGLGLDSIDALEIGVALHKAYGIKLDAETDNVQQHFASVRSLTEFVASHR